MNKRSKVIAVSVLGAAFGYSTAAVAEKFAFPKKQAVEIGGVTVANTQGLLPACQPFVANLSEKTIRAVLNSPRVLPSVQRVLMSDSYRNFISDLLIKILYVAADSKSINEIINTVVESDSRQAVEEYLKDLMSRIVVNMTDKEFLSDLISTEGTKIIKEMSKSSVTEKFFDEKLLKKLTDAISLGVNNFIDANGTEQIVNVAFMEINSLMDLTIPQILRQFSIDENEMREIITATYDVIVNEILTNLIMTVDFAGIVKNVFISVDFVKLNAFLNERLKPLLIACNLIGAAVGALIGGFAAFKLVPSDT